MTFSPNQSILQQYAKVLVRFALNGGEGIKPMEVVRLVVSEAAKPLYIALRNEILRAGGIPLAFYQPDDVSREYYELANEQQLSYFPEVFYTGMAGQIDHTISIIADTDLHELEGIDPKKIMMRGKAMLPFRKLLDAKENQGKYTWTLALYGTPAMAREANMSLEEYWQEIVHACFLDEEDPIAKWKSIMAENERLKNALNNLAIEKVHVVGQDVDLWVKLGSNRQWLGGSGRNIPSFEVFISPDWRETEGHISFNQPLYRYGNLIEGIKLVFKEGRVVESSATKNEAILKEMIATENADKIGEFSLTDKRLSRIQRFMAETLFDENISGEFGNTHIALGNAYQDSFKGDAASITPVQWTEMGFNSSSVHTDVISTTNRTVTAFLADGSEKTIYKDGMFTL